jgi:restriction system protein
LTVPAYDKFMLPILQLLAEGKERSITEINEAMMKKFSLSAYDLNERNESGQTTFYNRVAWARTYMKKAGLLASTAAGRFKITPRGVEVLNKRPPEINLQFLLQFPEFKEFRAPTKLKGQRESQTTIPIEESQTPEEIISTNYAKHNAKLAEDLLDSIKGNSPKFFENLVLDLLVAMGYGGSRQDAEAVGRSGDGGIDGIVKQDKLGLDTVYVQAKKWDSSVPGDRIRSFAGSLEENKATKGIFITTSSFSEGAKKSVEALGKKIILIDGEKLTQLMIEHGIGLTSGLSYTVKRVDSEYFSEE